MILFGENVYPTRLILNYTKAFKNRDNLKAFIAPNTKDIIMFLDNNGRLYVHTGRVIHRLYCYIFLHLTLHIITLIILVLHIPPTMIQKLYIYLFQIST